MVCYSNEQCTAKNNDGNINYADACKKCGKYYCKCEEN